jgi:aspartyl-tRNA(Asn)/glutamyl-tRNA(Gln) amidotransferase subunit A
MSARTPRAAGTGPATPAPPGGEPTHWSLVEAADAVAARRISSEELVRACLARIERTQPALNTFLGVEAEDALAAARVADAELARGRPRGPLHGVPLAHKDMFYRAGKLCTCGSLIRRDWRPDVTCTLLERLDAAGAITVGRLNMNEFATGPHGLNQHTGHCRNPWNPAHITGGSSSGSGAAVAARQVFGALGSDTGGSVRLPAAFCGVVGLKPTYGRVSRFGMLPLSFSTDQAGPLTRTVRDAARVLGLIAGHDPRDPTSSREPVPDYEARLGRPIRGMRIGLPANYYTDGVTGPVRAALQAAQGVFAGLGAELREVRLPDHDLAYPLATLLTRTEGAAAHQAWLHERPQDYSPQVRARLMIGLFVPASRYLDALRLRGAVLQAVMEQVFSQVDVLLVPGTSFPAPPIAQVDVGDSPGFLELLAAIGRCTLPANYLGLPALALPIGFSPEGLPLSGQLIGRPFGEARLLQLGDAYQRSTDWHTRVPRL